MPYLRSDALVFVCALILLLSLFLHFVGFVSVFEIFMSFILSLNLSDVC